MASMVFRAMWKRHLIEMRRYWFDTISGIVTLLIFFLLLFYGAKAFGAGSNQLGTTLEGIVVGYMVWALGLFTYSALSQDLVAEAQQGTLEQLAMSPFGLGRLLAVSISVNFVFQLFWMSLMLLLMMATTGKWLHIDIVSLIPLLLLTVTGIAGIGFAFGGLAVVFKRIQAFLGIFQIGFIALVAVSPSKFKFMKFLPLSWGNHLVSQVMIKGTSIFEMNGADLLFLLIHAFVWFALGYAAFRLLEKVARSRGLLGHY